LDPLQQFHVLLVLRAPELNAGLQVRSHQSRVRGRITSLNLLATLLLMQPRTRLALPVSNSNSVVSATERIHMVLMRAAGDTSARLGVMSSTLQRALCWWH